MKQEDTQFSRPIKAITLVNKRLKEIEKQIELIRLELGIKQ